MSSASSSEDVIFLLSASLSDADVINTQKTVSNATHIISQATAAFAQKIDFVFIRDDEALKLLIPLIHVLFVNVLSSFNTHCRLA